MQRIIDFHTHAFPDELASRAMAYLEEEGGIKARLDGTVSSLLGSMDKAGIEKSVVCSIATKPSQFETILNWSKSILSERIVPFPSIHPADPLAIERVSEIRGEGFKGIKFHPYYQDFNIDDELFFPVYERICRENLIVVMHTGFDFAFEKIRKADPARIIRVIEKFPDIKMVTTHLGAWDDWAEVEKHIEGKKIYMEISFSLEFLGKEAARKIILNHPAEHLLFGTDSPWTDQGETLALFRELGLNPDIEEMVLRENAVRLLESAG
jgi:hypothetical protein